MQHVPLGHLGGNDGSAQPSVVKAMQGQLHVMSTTHKRQTACKGLPAPLRPTCLLLSAGRSAILTCDGERTMRTFMDPRVGGGPEPYRHVC